MNVGDLMVVTRRVLHDRETRAASIQESDAAAIEAQLAAEGLAPLDSQGNTVSSRGLYALGDTEADAMGEARETYLAWAKDVLADPACFERKRRGRKAGQQREVWQRHADGMSNGEISGELGISREAVKRALGRVTKRAPRPPVLNPWRKSGREEAWYERASPRALARVCKIAIEVAGIGPVLEAIGNDRKLLRLLPQERTLIMAGTENEKTKGNPKAFTTYAVIDLTQPLAVPGVSVRKAQLLNAEARQHAGGMDVLLTDERDGTETVVTIPWHQIKFAKRPSSAA